MKVKIGQTFLSLSFISLDVIIKPVLPNLLDWARSPTAKPCQNFSPPSVETPSFTLTFLLVFQKFWKSFLFHHDELSSKISDLIKSSKLWWLSSKFDPSLQLLSGPTSSFLESWTSSPSSSLKSLDQTFLNMTPSKSSESDFQNFWTRRVWKVSLQIFEIFNSCLLLLDSCLLTFYPGPDSMTRWLLPSTIIKFCLTSKTSSIKLLMMVEFIEDKLSWSTKVSSEDPNHPRQQDQPSSLSDKTSCPDRGEDNSNFCWTRQLLHLQDKTKTQMEEKTK